jgi:hypothetical protein
VTKISPGGAAALDGRLQVHHCLYDSFFIFVLPFVLLSHPHPTKQCARAYANNCPPSNRRWTTRLSSATTQILLPSRTRPRFVR